MKHRRWRGRRRGGRGRSPLLGGVVYGGLPAGVIAVRGVAVALAVPVPLLRGLLRLLLLLRGAITAINRVGLMMNVPRKSLEEVLAQLPALGAPTISQLADERWVAVNTVIQERLVRELLPKLKACGAAGIVEYPLSKIVA